MDLAEVRYFFRDKRGRVVLNDLAFLIDKTR